MTCLVSSMISSKVLTRDLKKTTDSKLYCGLIQQFGNIAVAARRCVFTERWHSYPGKAFPFRTMREDNCEVTECR